MQDDTEIGEAENPIVEAIGAAEEIHDPLDGLVEKSAADPGAAFRPDVLEQLAALKTDDPAKFEVVRAQLKKAGCRVRVLDNAIAEESPEPGGRDPSQADFLVDLAQTADLFHAPDGTGYADVDVKGHRETRRIDSEGFRNWLRHRYYEATKGAPNSEALQSALNVIKARAQFDGPERIVHVRVGGLNGKLYVDLCDKTWRAVEIDTTGWRVINTPPVRFRRAAGRINRDAAFVSQRPVRCRVRASGRLGAGVSARSRSLSGDRTVWRARNSEVHLFEDPACHS
jgi:hypothetical protein